MDRAENAFHCAACGKPMAADARFCPHCGSERPAGDGPGNVASPETERSMPGGMVWETRVGLLTNPVVVKQLALVVVGATLLMAALLSFLLAVQGEWEGIPMMLLISLGGGAALSLLMLFVILVFFGNRILVRFGVSDEGVLVETVDARARMGSRAALILGALGDSMTAAGAGLAAASGERQFCRWQAVVEAVYHPRRHTISLRNHWRTVAFLACTPDNYEQVAAVVRRRVEETPVREGVTFGRNPLPRLLGRSALVVLAALPVFLLPYPFELDLLVPLIMLCFALATVWLIHFFGWVVIGCALWIAAEIVLIALRVQDSIFASVGSYRNVEILNAGDWLALGLAAAGLTYLVAHSWRAARGRIPSALSDDDAAMTE